MAAICPHAREDSSLAFNRKAGLSRFELKRELLALSVTVLLVVSLGVGYFAGTSTVRTETSTSTTTLFQTSYLTSTIVTTTTSQPTGAGEFSNEFIGPTKGVDLTGCSISNDTCTFLITNIDQPSDIGTTLDKGLDCVDLTYGSGNNFGGGAATSCTSSPSYYISSITATGTITNFTAIFSQKFGGVKAPVVGQSVYGCIGYTTETVNGTDYGCLAFLGAFTP